MKTSYPMQGILFYLTEPSDDYDKTYNPPSVSEWEYMKSMEPAGFQLGYVDYVRIKEIEFNIQLENRKNAKYMANKVPYSVWESHLLHTQKELRSVMRKPNFVEWSNDTEEIVNDILDLTIQYSSEVVHKRDVK
jgi:hypothetical protein